MSEYDEQKVEGLNIDKMGSQDIRKKTIVFKEDGGDVKLIEINEINKSKPGKHGAAKYNFSGTNLKTGKYTEFTESSGTLMTVCTLVKIPVTLVDLDKKKEMLSCYDAEGKSYEMATSKINPEELKKLEEIMEANPGQSILFSLVDTPYLSTISDVKIDTSS
ncbi:hypothetical protein NECID01_0509 [Nematocida sp. AWRm77]|nr:hypothetical protein NECID01_0509 [Nematocida sp. AWRm77]